MTSTRAAIYPEDEFYDKLSSPLIKVIDQTDATSVNSDISHQVSQHDINALAVNPTFSQIVGLALVVSLVLAGATCSLFCRRSDSNSCYHCVHCRRHMRNQCKN